MKRPNTRRLALQHETIRRLGAIQLQCARGGGTQDEANGCVTGVAADLAVNEHKDRNTGVNR